MAFTKKTLNFTNSGANSKLQCFSLTLSAFQIRIPHIKIDKCFFQQKSRLVKIYHTVSLMISGTLSSCFDGNNWLIVKPDCIHISSTFWRPLISTKDLRTHLRNLGTCSPSRCFTDSSKNFIGSDFSDANTGATKKG